MAMQWTCSCLWCEHLVTVTFAWPYSQLQLDLNSRASCQAEIKKLHHHILSYSLVKAKVEMKCWDEAFAWPHSQLQLGLWKGLAAMVRSSIRITAFSAKSRSRYTFDQSKMLQAYPTYQVRISYSFSYIVVIKHSHTHILTHKVYGCEVTSSVPFIKAVVSLLLCTCIKHDNISSYPCLPWNDECVPLMEATM